MIGPRRLAAATAAVRGRARRLLARLGDEHYLRRWAALGAALGVLAGLVAIGFYELLELLDDVLVGGLGGYDLGAPRGEGDAPVGDPLRPWAVPLVVAGGCVVSAWLVARLSRVPGATDPAHRPAGSIGTDAAVAGVHGRPDRLSLRDAAVEVAASAVTMGSGGSAGRLGPSSRAGAALGQALTRTLSLSPADRRIAATAGLSAGVAAVFRVPLGGALLGAELLYREDVESDAVLPSLVASVVAYSVFGAVEGFEPVFGTHAVGERADPLLLVWFAVLGLLCGLAGRAYVRLLETAPALLARLPGPAWLRPAYAGLLVGGVGVAVPGVLGTGYGRLQEALSAPQLAAMPLVLVLVLPLAKAAATALTVGSGAAGGVFAPGLVVGGATGAAVWQLAELAGSAPLPPVAFVAVGMVACFGAVGHAHLATMIMVVEMTGSLGLLPLAMVSLVVASLVVGDRSLYGAQVRDRAEARARRGGSGLADLGGVRAGDAAARPRCVLPAGTSAAAAVTLVAAAGVPGAPVVDGRGRLLGTVDLDRLRRARPQQPVEALADAGGPSLSAAASLLDALEQLAETAASWSAVVDEQLRLVGIVSAREVADGYGRLVAAAAARGAAAAAGDAGGGRVLEVVVGPAAPAAGRSVGEAGFPAGVVVITVLRADRAEPATAGTVLAPGCRVTLLAPAAAHDRVRALLADPPAA